MDRIFLSVVLALCITVLRCSPASYEDKPTQVRLLKDRIAISNGSPSTDEKPLLFAVASVLSPERSITSYQIFAQYLGKHLQRRVEVVQRKTYFELNELLRKGIAEAGLVCSGAYAVGREEFGLRSLVVPVVNNETTYRAYIIVRRGSRYKNIDQMRGASFAFSDPLSNSGYRYIATKLRARDTNPNLFFSRTLFTYSHDSAILAVRDRIADGAVINNLVWDLLQRQTPDIAKELDIIERSPPFAINPIVLSPLASPTLGVELTRILLAMNTDPAGKKVLAELGISSFVTIAESAYDPIVASWRELGSIQPAGAKKP